MSEEFLSEYSDTEVKETPKEPESQEAPKADANYWLDPGWHKEQEEIAVKDGWAPKEDWKGDPKDWVPAPIFNVRGPLFNKMKEQKGVIDSLKGEQDEMKKTVSSIVEKTRNYERSQAEKRIAELRKEHVRHMEEGNYEKAMETDAEIDAAKKDLETAPAEEPKASSRRS